MTKFKMFADFDREEQFLNDMAKKGFRLVKHNCSSPMYKFKSAKPADLNYRIDYRVFKKKREYKDYLALFNESGWDHICGSFSSGTQYFLPAEHGAQTEDIFSDVNSKADRFKRYAANSLSAFCLSLIYIFNIQMCGNIVDWSFIKLSTWIRTPELWERTDPILRLGVLFETLFALHIMLFLFCLIAVLLFNGALAVKTLMLYKAKKQKL